MDRKALYRVVTSNAPTPGYPSCHSGLIHRARSICRIYERITALSPSPASRNSLTAAAIDRLRQISRGMLITWTWLNCGRPRQIRPTVG